MGIDWIKDDGTFTDDWRDKALPQELRGEASLADVKGLVGLAKAFVDTKKTVGGMVKIPDDERGKRDVLQKHFQPILDADAAKAKKDAEDAATAAKQKAEEDAKAEAKTRLEKAQNTVKTVLSGADGKDFDKNLELCRRVVRGEHCPRWIAEGIARVAGVEIAKLTDDQIKTVISADPAVAETLHRIAGLTQNARTEHGDGGGGSDKEVKPEFPKSPEMYKTLPDSNKEKQWFIRRGYDFETNQWLGRA